jgi:hypothetical protein
MVGFSVEESETGDGQEDKQISWTGYSTAASRNSEGSRHGYNRGFIEGRIRRRAGRRSEKGKWKKIEEM